MTRNLAGYKRLLGSGLTLKPHGAPSRPSTFASKRGRTFSSKTLNFHPRSGGAGVGTTALDVEHPMAASQYLWSLSHMSTMQGFSGFLSPNHIGHESGDSRPILSHIGQHIGASIGGGVVTDCWPWPICRAVTGWSGQYMS